MPLLLVDLDNTLVDRAAAFAVFAHEYVAELGRDASDAQWLIRTDGDGFTPRDQVAESVRQRFGLESQQTAALIATLRAGLVEQMTLDPAVPVALGRARDAGWQIVIVTNGTHAQQSRKISVLGLGPLVDAVVVSESAGHRKPEPEIFHLAATAAESDLAGAWMIGDSAHADIGGAQAVGIASVWLHRSRTWPAEQPVPDHQADSFVDAVDHVLTVGAADRWGAADHDGAD
ncbi:HAD family hydrolase [Microlunatus sp. Y2014]|uniref:HAD family hydrolase n=1 Tax=Microlunatus sp. Y2014 TaxID=3418488 RepID=UPI003DA6F569